MLIPRLGSSGRLAVLELDEQAFQNLQHGVAPRTMCGFKFTS